MRFLAATIAALFVSTGVVSAQTTTRIETRPYYGYVVSVDKGVRVWRPLPPHDRVIINPEGRTPLHLSFNDHRHTSSSYNRHDHRYEGGDGYSRAAATPGYYLPARRRAVKRAHGVDVWNGGRPGHYRVPVRAGKH